VSSVFLSGESSKKIGGLSTPVKVVVDLLYVLQCPIVGVSKDLWTIAALLVTFAGFANVTAKDAASVEQTILF
jgi:hypothetical protein